MALLKLVVDKIAEYDLPPIERGINQMPAHYGVRTAQHKTYWSVNHQTALAVVESLTHPKRISWGVGNDYSRDEATVVCRNNRYDIWFDGRTQHVATILVGSE
jgi:hypothetical protein